MPIAQFSGLASGIDSAALIDAIIEAREITNVQRRAQIEQLESENDSLEELNTKILGLLDIVDQMRSVNGGGVRKTINSNDPTVASAAANSSAISTSFTLDVTSIADVASASFDDSYSDLGAVMAPNAIGTQTIGVDVGLAGELVSIDVNITNTTTISEYVNAVNNHASAAGRLAASLVNVGTDDTPDYRISFTSLQSGTAKGTIAFDVPASVNFGGNSDLQTQTTDQATDAVFTVSGIASSITRDSNTIEDVIPGITMQLFSTGTSTMTVGDDADASIDLVNQMVDSFNDIVAFVNENDIVQRLEDSSGVDNVFGSLAQTQVDNDFISQFRAALSAASSANGTEVTGLSEIGLSTNRDGTLTLNEDDFAEAVGSDPTGVTEVLRSFADDAAGLSGVLSLYTRFNGVIDSAQDANEDEMENINEAIAQLERYTAKVRQSLEQRFARLEAVTGELQSQAEALTGVLAGLG